MVYTLRFFLFKNAVCFIILTYFVPVLFTLCAKIKKKFRRQKVKNTTLVLTMFVLRIFILTLHDSLRHF